MEGLLSHKNMFLLFHSQYVSVQISHHQVIREEYTNDDSTFLTNHLKMAYLGRSML
jgi:hypothetical protein